ncbi:MAG: nuclear transport factor 2 family protein [Acidobacteriota bacterium]|nr:nuclear transport factor 2 family protein [Acidobacteriota bacterium]
MRIIIAVIISVICVIALFAQTGNQLTNTNAKLLAEAQAFEKELIETLRKGDRTKLETILGEGFLFVHSTGLLETRDEYLKSASVGNLMLQRTEFENSEQNWRVFEGNTVVRYQRTVLRNKAANTENRMRNIAVYVKTGAKGWQWVSGQSTKLSVRPKASAVDLKVYDDYAGVY